MLVSKAFIFWKESICFDFAIGQRCCFRAKIAKFYTQQHRHRGETYDNYLVVMKDIVECSSGTPFRDHCHIQLSKAEYERLSDSVGGANCSFTAEIYRYSKLVQEGRCSFRRFQLGLRKLRKLKTG